MLWLRFGELWRTAAPTVGVDARHIESCAPDAQGRNDTGRMNRATLKSHDSCAVVCLLSDNP
jgi:hypothetical protein